MRLINTATLQLEEFPNELGLEYAILSHRWEAEEVSLQDMHSLKLAKLKKGFRKIEKCCEEALKAGLPYVWVDTNCIDKTSSAELSEAINSMFRYYQNAEVCYAYLSDVGQDGRSILQELKHSQWFKRGWTLQELLAPQFVHFFNNAWLRIGSKKRLVRELSEITAIPEEALQGRSFLEFSVAERMRWAAERETTRTEDRAYSLMGLFDVNMPMLYGEGSKAFLRLQEEIIRRSDDESIFAWSGVPAEGSGLLASGPECFVGCGSISHMAYPSGGSDDTYNMTNRGLSMTLRMTPWYGLTYLASLKCGSVDRKRIGIFVQTLSGGQYRRVQLPNGDDLVVGFGPVYVNTTREFRDCRVHVRQDGLVSSIPPPVSGGVPQAYGIRLRSGMAFDLSPYTSSPGSWNPSSRMALLNPGQFGTVAEIDLRPLKRTIQYIKIGLDFNFRPRCVFASNIRLHNLGRVPTESNELVSKSIWDVHFTEKSKWTHDLEVEPMTNPVIRDEDRMWALELSPVFNGGLFQLLTVKKRPEYHKDVHGHVDIRVSGQGNQKVWEVSINLFDAASGADQYHESSAMATD